MVKNKKRMDRKGLRVLHANQYRVKAVTESRSCASVPDPGPTRTERGNAAPPTLLGGGIGKNIAKMDAGERTASIGIDWLQGTVPFDRLQVLMLYIEKMSGNPPEILNHGFLGYQCAAEYHPYGIKVMWDCDEQARKRHGNRVLLQFCGESLSQFFPSDLHQFLFDLSVEFWFRASRIDLAFDDYEKIIRPEEVNEYANQGSYSGFRKHKFIGGSKRSGVATDEGIYFGSRGKNGGGKFLRCYAKDIESEGETDSIRWEVEFSKEKANEVYFNLAMSESVEDLATKIALFIGGSIEFCERYESGKIDPSGKLAFWEQILHYLGAAVLRSPQKLTEIKDSMEWIEQSVAPSLKKIREAIGSEWYESWLREQLERVVLKQRALGQIFYYQIINGEPAPF